MTKRMRNVVTAIAAIAALATGGAVFAQAQNSGQSKPAPAQEKQAGADREKGEREDDGREEEGDQQATGPEADRAKEAALNATGGGKATSVEREESEREERAEEQSERDSDDRGGDKQEGFQSPQGAAWEVEVTKTDGTQVEVYLDKDYKELATHKADADE